jgi:starch synthase/alpha-amylase
LFALFSSGAGRSEDSRIPGHRLHLAHDRAFYYADDIEANPPGDNVKLSLAFQREVIHHLIPTIQPDVIHCYDWMAGLIPAAAKRIGIPCLFTIYDIRSTRIPLWLVEDMGIDVAGFWENLFYQRMPGSYEETRKFNPVDFLLSGIYAADYVNAASMRFAAEVFVRRNSSNTDAFRQLLRKKCEGGCGSADFSGNQTVQEHIGIYRNLLRGVAFSSAN